MKTKMVFALLLAVAMCSASTLNLIGFEDTPGPLPGSDRDANDVQYLFSGFVPRLLAPYLFVPPVGYTETPLSTPAWWTDGGVATGTSVTFTYLGGQTSDVDSVYAWVGASPVGVLLGHGTTTFATNPGDAIGFSLYNGSQWLYSNPASNPGGLPDVVVGSAVPEPLPFALIGAGLVALGAIRRRRRG